MTNTPRLLVAELVEKWIQDEFDSEAPFGTHAHGVLCKLLSAIEDKRLSPPPAPMGTDGVGGVEPILTGRWHYGHSHLCCGTLRVMRADFDTVTDIEQQNKIMQNICDILNTRSQTGWIPVSERLPLEFHAVHAYHEHDLYPVTAYWLRDNSAIATGGLVKYDRILWMYATEGPEDVHCVEHRHQPLYRNPTHWKEIGWLPHAQPTIPATKPEPPPVSPEMVLKEEV